MLLSKKVQRDRGMARVRGGVLQRVLLVTFRSFPPRHVAREQLWSRGEPVTYIEREDERC